MKLNARRCVLSLVAFPVLAVGVGLSSCGSSGGTGAASQPTLKVLNSTAFITVPPVITSAPTTSTIVGGTLEGEQIWKVVSGDTVVGIARRYGITPNELVTYNQWPEGLQHPLYPGDEVKIQPGATLVDQSLVTTPPSQTVTDATAATTTTVGTDVGTYTVADGDTLSGIARKTGTTVDAIIAANGWTDGIAHVIYAGLKIKLPVKAG